MFSQQSFSEDINTQCLESSTLEYDQAPPAMEEDPVVPKPWASLIGVTKEIRWDLYPIEKDSLDRYNFYTIGRSKKNKFQFESSLFVSNQHCSIYCKINEADPQQSLEAWIEDTSTNGTFINRTKLVKNVPRQLHQNDEILLMDPTNRDRSSEISDHTFLLVLFLPTRPSIQCHDLTASAVLQSEAAIERSSTLVKLLQQHRRVHDFYEVRTKLGEGAMGTVYKGVKKSNGSTWAIKCIDMRKVLLRPDINPAAIIHEAEMIRKLRHPGIIQLEDVFADDRNLYLVMELSHG